MDILVKCYMNCLHKYVVFSGRSSRQEYAIFNILNMVISFLLSFIPILNITLGPIFSLAMLLPTIAVAVRRLHDLNQTGWLIIVPYVLTFISGLLVTIDILSGLPLSTSSMLFLTLTGLVSLGMGIWMLFFKGTRGLNKFGDDPIRKMN